MRVLVTGGTGYLGSAIVRALDAAGHSPVVFARTASRARLPGTAIDDDIRDREAVRRAVDGADAVCHSAALVSVWRPRAADFDDVNVTGLQNVLDACRNARTPRIVYTSSFLALPPAGRTSPIVANDYQRTKVRAHERARAAVAAGLPVVTLVPGVIYGPGPATDANLISRMIGDHLAGRLPGLIGADRAWSYAYVDDVARAHVRAIVDGRPGSEYALGGANVPQMALFEIVRRLTGRPLPRRIPFAIATAVAMNEEAKTALTGRPPRLTRGVVEIFRHDWSMNSDRSLAELSYRITPLSDGIQAVLSALS